MGGHHHEPPIPKIPDWRIYKVEDVPELMKTKRALAGLGLKDPWLRNEVWRYNTKVFGTHKERVVGFLFRGFKWGLAAALVAVGIEKLLAKDNHGHGTEHH